ncbi:hypothetical protein ABGV40_27240 [Paenibacillus amylolyticus]|uniref:hypothetical protein n=1 Tax=Paenibacillus amylolyticus TaxID=1451 RepID=UPI003242BDD1
MDKNQVTDISIRGIEVFSIISSVFSIVLGIVAIWLSILFYRMSEKSSRELEKSSNSIDASVKKLETLFDKLYSGTFSMMKETVTDMRKHVYSKSNISVNSDLGLEIEDKTNIAVSKAVDEIRRSQKTEEELEELINSVIKRSKEVEKSITHSAIRETVIEFLKINGESTYSMLRDMLISKKLMKNQDITLFSLLEDLADEGLINDPFHEDDETGTNAIYHSSMIRLK